MYVLFMTVTGVADMAIGLNKPGLELLPIGTYGLVKLYFKTGFSFEKSDKVFRSYFPSQIKARFAPLFVIASHSCKVRH